MAQKTTIVGGSEAAPLLGTVMDTFLAFRAIAPAVFLGCFRARLTLSSTRTLSKRRVYAETAKKGARRYLAFLDFREVSAAGEAGGPTNRSCSVRRSEE